MQADSGPPKLVVLIGVLAISAFCLVTGAVSTAAAAGQENRATLTLLPSAAKKLGAKHVRLISKGVARGRGTEVWLPVNGGKVTASRATLRQGGSLVIKTRAAGKRARQLRLSRVELRLRKRSGVLLAREGRAKARVPFFRLRFGARALKLDAANGTATLRNARLMPTGKARQLMRKRLGLAQVRIRPLARLTAHAHIKRSEVPELVPPPLKPLPPEPPLLARPASAVDVTSASVVWCARASWIRYIGSGTTSGGASREDPFVVNEANKSQVCDQKRAEVTSGATSYRYYFTFKNGWYDAASGKAALYFTGKVGFRYPERGIDLDFNDIEVELNGAATRTIFRMEGREGTEIPAHRTVFTDNGDPLPALDTSVPGTVKSGEMPAWLSAGTGGGVFADFYLPPNNDFGWVSVEFSVPQPD